ncbi:SGNH/GDSL hydrolase family protein [Lutibacter sp.]
MNSELLNMDMERLIVVVLFFLFLYVFLKLFLFLAKTAKYKFIRYLSQGLLLCTIIVLSIEVIVRFSYFLYYKEVNFLVYPFRAFTRNYININWTPQYYFRKDGNLINDIPIIIKEYQGLNYFKVTQNHLGFRYNTAFNARNINVVTLGGSSTWGHNTDDQTYPDYLEDFLGKDFKVFNLGKRAHVAGNFINNFQKSQLNHQVKINIAILYCGHNDSGSHHGIFPAYASLGTALFYNTEKFSLIKYSLLVRNLSVLLFSSTAEKIINKQLLRKVDFVHDNFTKSQQSFENNVVKIIEYLRSQNNDMKVLLVPEYTNYYISFLDFKKSINHQDYIKSKKMELYKIINYDLFTKYKSLQKIAKQFPENVHFIDIDFFAAYSPNELLMDTVHLYPKGNKILAQNIANYINKELKTSIPNSVKKIQ